MRIAILPKFKWKSLIIVALALSTFAISNCRKENYFEGSDAKLSISTDTVYFDTVFTKLPGVPYPRSITKTFVLRNPYKDYVRTTITLAGGDNSPYRINVDGIPTTHLEDYEIRPKDSIFIFVQCTLEPNNLTQPALVMDSIIFNTNGSIQDLKLAAYGWDAYYFHNTELDCDDIWDKTDKPYVIVSSALVKENCKLTIEKGVEIYSSADSRLIVEGTLDVNGTKDEPVLFRADRLDPRFDDVGGQWQGIHIYKKSVNNSIENAIIKNATVGVRVDSLSNNSNPKLDIRNTVIQNTSSIGIFGWTGEIYAENCVFANSASFTFLGYWGGRYDFRHCTFADYNIDFIRRTPQVALNSVELDENDNILRTFPLKYNIQNCIIFGSLEDEVLYSFNPSVPPDSNIENCLIRTTIESLASNGNILNKDPNFKSIFNYNYELDTLSPAMNGGKILSPPINFDLLSRPRIGLPDMGAYERQE